MTYSIRRARSATARSKPISSPSRPAAATQTGPEPARLPRPGLLQRHPGVDLSQREGLEETTSLGILSEIGVEMSRWPTVKHFTSWLGLCPPQRVSGGQILSRRTTSCANGAATALRLAAAALHPSQSA